MRMWKNATGNPFQKRCPRRRRHFEESVRFVWECFYQFLNFCKKFPFLSHKFPTSANTFPNRVHFDMIELQVFFKEIEFIRPDIRLCSSIFQIKLSEKSNRLVRIQTNQE